MDSIFEEEAMRSGGRQRLIARLHAARRTRLTRSSACTRTRCGGCNASCAARFTPTASHVGTGPSAEEAAGKKASSKRLTWDDAMARATDTDLGNARPFSIRDTYEDGDVVHHPAFDIGFVIEQLPDNKVEVIFRDGGSRILVHNRGDLAARMPDIAEIPAPREAKKKKRAKKVETPATPLPVRSKAEVEAAIDRARNAAQMRMDDSAKTAEEHNKKLKLEAKKIKATKPAKATAVPAKAAPVANVAKGAAKPAAKVPAKAAAKPAKPVAKAAAKGAAKKAAGEEAGPEESRREEAGEEARGEEAREAGEEEKEVIR